MRCILDGQPAGAIKQCRRMHNALRRQQPQEQQQQPGALTAAVDELCARQLSSRGTPTAVAANAAAALQPGAVGEAVARLEAQAAAQHVRAALVARQRQLLNLRGMMNSSVRAG